jgi:endonuclease III
MAAALAAPSWPARGRLPLGNRRDPLDELFFILLTTMTQYGAVETFRRVQAEFTPWRRLLEPGAEGRLKATIAPLGLSNQKAPRAVEVARRLKADFGKVSLAPLRRMPDEEAEDYLRSLPGVGVKVARCVLMYSLGRDVCPVDTHVYRVARRVGLVPSDVSYARAHAAVQDAVPPGLRYGLHVALVQLGRDVCGARRPDCVRCPLAEASLCREYETRSAL